MHIIPVIDLLDGHAVHAIRGQRESYQPVTSQLCPGSAPVDIARAMLAYCDADTLYLADLDALTGKPAQADALRTLCHALPGITLWLDAGFRTADDFTTLMSRVAVPEYRIVPVFGSESLAHESPFIRYPDAILSLDQRGGAPMGGDAWWRDTAQWPQRIIAMTLDRVGAFSGPDLALFGDLRSRAGDQRLLIGAGGIRHGDDLNAAAQAGAHAWLVASAIHDQRIPPRPHSAHAATPTPKP